MPSAPFPHPKGMGVVKGPADKSLQSQPHDPPQEATARISFHLIIRRRESGIVHGARVAPAITCSRGHLRGQSIAS